MRPLVCYVKITLELKLRPTSFFNEFPHKEYIPAITKSFRKDTTGGIASTIKITDINISTGTKRHLGTIPERLLDFFMMHQKLISELS